jgi:hypothetical protein
MESVLVKGLYSGGVLEIERVYNSMPPKMEYVYPRSETISPFAIFKLHAKTHKRSTTSCSVLSCAIHRLFSYVSCSVADNAQPCRGIPYSPAGTCRG